MLLPSKHLVFLSFRPVPQILAGMVIHQNDFFFSLFPLFQHWSNCMRVLGITQCSDRFVIVEQLHYDLKRGDLHFQLPFHINETCYTKWCPLFGDCLLSNMPSLSPTKRNKPLWRGFCFPILCNAKTVINITFPISDLYLTNSSTIDAFQFFLAPLLLTSTYQLTQNIFSNFARIKCSSVI